MLPPFSTIPLKVTLNLQLYFGVNERDVYICRKLYFNHTCSIFIINHNHIVKYIRNLLNPRYKKNADIHDDVIIYIQTFHFWFTSPQSM